MFHLVSGGLDEQLWSLRDPLGDLSVCVSLTNRCGWSFLCGTCGIYSPLAESAAETKPKLGTRHLQKVQLATEPTQALTACGVKGFRSITKTWSRLVLHDTIVSPHKRLRFEF